MATTLINRAQATAGPGERWAKTTCNGCVSQTCGMLVLVRNGRVIKAVGDPENPFNQGKLCAKSHALVFAINDPRRIRKPMKRTNPEKGRGVDPKWVEISYQEAYDLMAKALKEQRQRDPRRLAFMPGNDFSTNQWAGNIFSAPWGDHMIPLTGAYCGHSLHAQNYLYHGAFHVVPDWKYVKYIINLGSQKGANINHASLTATIEAAEARSRGVKFVSVDPLATNMTSKANEWVPIRPGTDGALALAWMNVLVNELRIFDAEFLRTYTNAPYLIKQDGRYARDPSTNKPVIWDESSGGARVYDDPDLQRPALEGKYRVRLSDGKTVEARTGFEVFKEEMRKWAPEHVSEITSVPVDTIRRIAREFGEAASIGSTIVIDGEVLPLRPVAVHWYRGLSGHRNGFNNGRILEQLMTLVGGMDVPGSILGEAVYMDPPGLRDRSLMNGERGGLTDAKDGILGPSGGPIYHRVGPLHLQMSKVSQPPRDADGYLGGKLFGLFPAASLMAGFLTVWGDMLHPDKHGKTLAPKLPETILCFFNNSIITNSVNPDEVAEMFRQAKFVGCVNMVEDEAVELADVVIPSAHFLERLEPFCNPETNFIAPTHEGEHYCFNMRVPVVENDIPHHWETWFEIADRLGMTPDVNESLNLALDLRGELRLDPEKRYNWRELMDRFMRQRLGRSLDDVINEGKGHFKWKKSVKERYPRVFYKNARIPFYIEEMVDMKENLEKITKEMGINWWDTRQYHPIPNWVPCDAWERKDRGQFDLVTVTYKLPFVQAQFGLTQPWARELAALHPYAWKIWLNSDTARQKGLADGDTVRIESQRNGRVVEGELKVSECVHPEVVGIYSAGGHWGKAFGDARGKYMAAWPALSYHSHETMDPMQGQPDHCVPVKVTKVEAKA